MLLRLERYYKHVGDYDFLDKTPVEDYRIRKQFKLISYTNSKQTLDKLFLKQVLVSELLSNQKIKLNLFEFKFRKSIVFSLTLRNKNWFLFLETCLNSIFLIDKMLKLNKIKQNQGSHFYLPLTFTRYFNLSTLTSTISLVNFSLTSRNATVLKSFYFIS